MQEERKRILDLVKSGKLSTEEALILFEALEGEQERKENIDANQEKDTYSNQEGHNENFEDEFSFNEKQSSQFTGTREKIMDFVNSAINKIKDFDISQSVEFPHVFQQTNVDVHQINIDVANGHVDVRVWDQPDIRVECQAKVYRKDSRDDARTYFIENSEFALENGILQFSTLSKWMKVDTIVYIPKKEYEKASFRTFNGNVSSSALTSHDLRAKTANGKVYLKGIESEKLDAETAHGKIDIVESKSNHLSAETMHGNIDISGDFHTIDLQTINGNLNSILKQGTDTLHAKAVTGNINVSIPKELAIQGECKSNLGSVKITVEDLEILEEKKDVMQKQTKFRRIGDAENPLHVFAETKTGTIIVKTEEEKSE